MVLAETYWLGRFDSYLDNLAQGVTALGATSEALPVTLGVPQGSMVGSMLFLSCVNSLRDVVQSN